MQKQKIDIVVISSVLNSDTLNEWFSLMLRCLADTTTNQVVIVSPYTNEKLAYAIESFEKSRNFGMFIQIDPINSSYLDFVQTLDYTLELLNKKYDVERIFSIFSPCQGDKQSLTSSIVQKLSKIDISSKDIIPEDKYMIEASSILMYRLIKKSESAKLFHLVLDPQEVNMSTFSNGIEVTSIFGHKLPYAESHPFILYEFADKLCSYINMSVNQLVDIRNSKDLSFVFGLTAFNEERTEIVEKSLYLNDNSKNRFYYYSKLNGQTVDTRLPYNEYLAQLGKSLTTLVIPAYDESTFSIHRFIEALANGCLSIIYKANYPVGFDNDQEIVKLIEKHLLVDDLSKLQEKIQYVENNWLYIFTELLCTEFIQKLMDKKNYITTLSKIIN